MMLIYVRCYGCAISWSPRDMQIKRYHDAYKMTLEQLMWWHLQIQLEENSFKNKKNG